MIIINITKTFCANLVPLPTYMINYVTQDMRVLACIKGFSIHINSFFIQ